jgi:hypothetical protein
VVGEATTEETLLMKSGVELCDKIVPRLIFSFAST